MKKNENGMPDKADDSPPLGSMYGGLKKQRRHHVTSIEQTCRITWKPQPISVGLASSAAVTSFLKNDDASLIIPSCSVTIFVVPLLPSPQCEKNQDSKAHHH